MRTMKVSERFACRVTGQKRSRPALAQRLHRVVQQRVRDERRNINMFWSLAQARVVISDWKEDYNHRRRQSALGYQAPGRGRRCAGDDGDGARLVGGLGGGP